MLRRLSSRFWENVSSFLLAFALAFAVWISAVVAGDPNEVRNFPRALTLEVRGQDPSMVLIGDLPGQVSLSLSAPISLWDRLISEISAVQVYVDLSGLGSGEHNVALQLETSLLPVRLVEIDPQEIVLGLEARATQEFPVTVVVLGEPALGYQLDAMDVSPDSVSVSGPESLVGEIEKIQAVVDIDGARESVAAQIELQALDESGNVISGLNIDPQSSNLNGKISQAGGYRDVAVKVETTGLPASGFRVISITVNPPIVTLFSNDAQLVAGLPGFVSTEPLDLTDIEQNLETRLALDLPEGVTLQGELQNVEVVIGVAAIESSIPLGVQVEVIGLQNGMTVEVSPEIVSVILSGPLTLLGALQEGDVRLLIDVSDLEAGTHLLVPQAEILLDDVQVLSITPGSVEVVISSGDSSNSQ